MKKQFLKIVVLSLVGLIFTTTIQAQQYEEAQEENYTDEQLEQSFKYQSTDASFHYNFQSNSNYRYQDADEGNHYNGSIIYPSGYRVSNGNSGSALGGIPDPLPDTPIDSNLYVLFFAALCYGVYQRKHLMSLAVRG